MGPPCLEEWSQLVLQLCSQPVLLESPLRALRVLAGEPVSLSSAPQLLLPSCGTSDEALPLGVCFPVYNGKGWNQKQEQQTHGIRAALHSGPWWQGGGGGAPPTHSPGKKGREVKWAFGSSTRRGRCKLLCSLNFLLELRVTPLLSHVVPALSQITSWVCGRLCTRAGRARAGSTMGPGRGQGTVPLSEAASAVAVGAAR